MNARASSSKPTNPAIRGDHDLLIPPSLDDMIQGITSALKKQLGMPIAASTRPDLSRANMDFLRMEQDKLRMDKVQVFETLPRGFEPDLAVFTSFPDAISPQGRRLERLASLLDQLQAHCSVVGEDNRQLIAEVHHTCRSFWWVRKFSGWNYCDAAAPTTCTSVWMSLYSLVVRVSSHRHTSTVSVGALS